MRKEPIAPPEGARDLPEPGQTLMSFMSGRDGDKEAVDPRLGRTEVILRRVRGTCLSHPIINAIFDGGPAKASRPADSSDD